MLEVSVNLRAIEDNYRFLKKISGLEIMPVVKADAYGHGMVQVAQVLESAGAERLAVGPLQEGLELAAYIDPQKIYSLIGPVHEADFARVPSLDLTCFVHCRHQLEGLAARALPGRSIKIGLKFDTGMRRLGFKA
ncbi:MAG: alanine racemase, partial [Desulfonatronovibrionaceae bacterium]